MKKLFDTLKNEVTAYFKDEPSEKEKELLTKEFDLRQSKLEVVKALEELNKRISETIVLLKK